MKPFDFKPDVGVSVRTAAELRAMSRELARLSSMLPRLGGSENQRTQERILVKLTAQNGASPPVYSGTEQSFTVAGGYENMPNGRRFTPDSMPIHERNNVRIASFPYYTEVMRRALVDGVPEYEFNAAPAELRGLTFMSNTAATSGDPGAGKVLWSNATQSSATQLIFNTHTYDDDVVSAYWTALTIAPPRFIFLQQADDQSRWQLWQCASATNITIPLVATVTSVGFGGAIENGKIVLTDFYGSADASETQGGAISYLTGTTQILGDGAKLAQEGIGSLGFDIPLPWEEEATYIGPAPPLFGDWAGMMQTSSGGAYSSLALLLHQSFDGQPWLQLVQFDEDGVEVDDVQAAYCIHEIGVGMGIGSTAALGPGCRACGGLIIDPGAGTFAEFPADLTTDVTGILPVANGGTGQATFVAALQAAGGATVAGGV